MRERTQGIIAIVIIGLICLTFALWGIQNYLQSHGNLDTIAKVNSTKITQKQLQTLYERAKQNIMLRTGKDIVLDQNQQQQMKNNILQELIKSEAFGQSASKMGFRANSSQVDAIIASIPIFQVNGQFSPQQFQDALSRMLYTEPEFVHEIQQTVINNQVHNGITMSSFVLPNETENFIKIAKQARDIGYTIISPNYFKNSLKINEQDIQQYYQQHQQQFQNPEQISIAYLELNANDLKNNIKYTPDEVQKYYNDHIDLYTSPARWQVQRIFVPFGSTDQASMNKAQKEITTLIKQAQSGADFTKLDQNYGKPAWIIKNQTSPDLASKLQLLKIGQISEPITTPNGYLVIKLLQEQEEKIQPFASIRNNVEKALQQDKLQQLFSDASSKLADLTYTNSDNLDTASKELNLPIKTTGFFTAQGDKTGLSSNPKILKAAFSDVVIKQNYNSDPIELAPGQLLVLRIKEHKPTSTKPLATVKNDIVSALTNQLGQQKAKEFGQQLVEEFKAAKDPQQISKKYKLTWIMAKKIDRQSNINHEIITAAFALPPTNTAETTGTTLSDGSFAVVQVNNTYPGNIKQLNAQQANAAQNMLETAFGENEYNLFMESLIKQVKIKQYTTATASDDSE